MRIVIVTHNIIQGDGQGRVNYELISGLLRQGHQVVGVANTVDDTLAAKQNFTWVKISKGKFPTNLIKGLAFGQGAARWLHHHRHKFDIIHACGWVSSSASDVNTSHLVHHAWLQSPAHTSRSHKGLYGAYQWIYTALNAHLEKQAYRSARRVIAVSEQVGQQLMAIGISAEQICVIRNGVDLVEFAPGPANRQQLGLPEDVPLALFVGDIRTPLKNLKTVLLALKDTPTVHCAIVGSTQGSPYPVLAQRLGLQDRVHFLGFRRDVADLMRSSDFFVFPSHYESFSLVLLEAMASGLPVITARTVGASPLITPSCGIVLDNPDDVTALTNVIQNFASHPEQCAQMGFAARKAAEKQSWEQMLTEYLMIYENVITQKQQETHSGSRLSSEKRVENLRSR